jgi:iron complex outermembrane receptor protein
LDAFFVNDLRINYSLKPKGLKNLTLSLLVNNLFNTEYESNGYTYSYLYYGLVTENFVYPQAGTNFLTAIKLRF